MLSGGALAFPLRITYSGPASCCGASLPVGLQNRVIAGSGIAGPYFNTPLPGGPWSQRVAWNGLAWTWSETSAVLQFANDLPLTYNAGTGLWTWSGTRNCACSPFAGVAMSVEWDPTAVASAAALRNTVDEVRPDTNELLRWTQPLEWLRGSKYVETALQTCCWQRNHRIGNYYKLNSQPEPRAAGQSLRWHW